MCQNILACNKLCKSYSPRKPVLKDFSIEVGEGKVFGLLGPNGCGKSTFLKLVSGLLVPDSGEILVCGVPRSEKTNADISYLPERPCFSLSMRIGELLDLFSDFYEDFDASLARSMLSDFSLGQDTRVRTLSKGNKEKLQLILVMSRRAKLYLLDEPIGGVDPAARDYILETIVKNRGGESSVIITTHLISDVEPILDDFAFMSYGGEIVLSGDAEDVRNTYGTSLDERFREVFKCSKNA